MNHPIHLRFCQRAIDSTANNSCPQQLGRVVSRGLSGPLAVLGGGALEMSRVVVWIARRVWRAEEAAGHITAVPSDWQFWSLGESP